MLAKLHGVARDVRDLRLIVSQASDVTKTSGASPRRQRLELSFVADAWSGKVFRVGFRCSNAVFVSFCHGMTPLQRRHVEPGTTAVKLLQLEKRSEMTSKLMVTD